MKKGITKKIDRACLICCGQTRVAHLGIDVCRACSVFYRRAEKGNSYTCRSSTKQCPLGPDLSCKRCRFDHIDRLLKQAKPAAQNYENGTNLDAPETACESFQHSSPTTSSTRTELPILERLTIHYRTMSRERLNSELHARPNPPHPMEISLETGPFYPATFATLTMSNQILLTALLDFGTGVFPEFGELEKTEKWDICVNMFYRFRIFEGCYRASLIFPGDLDRAFGGFTTWFSPNGMENFYSDAPTGDKAGAQEHMRHSSLRMHEIRSARELIQRVNPCHDEFLVVIALMFWSVGDIPLREEATQLGERYRQSVMKELHAFYKETMGLDDYATRLGELLMFLPTFERTHDMKEHFEM
ncbi:hypothetical protein PENTCL1PPCAC_15600, partial [Pristionchus entomophagus]